jgi:hypothetical protein
MTDQEQWICAVETVTDEYRQLAPTVKMSVDALLDRLVEAKLRVHSYAEQVQVGHICASCGGECCLTGKYHFTVIELLVYLRHERPLIVPRFASGRCPYLGEAGCLMAPGYRPYNCIIFNCEQVEGLMEPLEKQLFAGAERELRVCCEQVEKLFDNRFMHGILLNWERDVVEKGLPVLRGVAGSIRNL